MFRSLDETILVAGQISVDDIEAAKLEGVAMIINNRPDDEEPGQTPGYLIEAAARAAGMDYVAVPVTHAGFSLPHVDAMNTALGHASGKVLAYCRSGTRSTMLWALARASRGELPDQLIAKAGRAGYDLMPIRTMLNMAGSRG